MSDTLNAHASSSKHPHKHKHKKDKTKSKSKHSEKTSSKSKSKSKESSGPFEHRLSWMRLSVPPKFASDWLSGVREVLDGLLMRYVPQMQGVLLAHWEHEFAEDTVNIINECPYGIVEIKFRSIIWAPKIGQKLSGTHSLSSPSHISLLFSKTFNISIPLQHIPQEEYEFEHTDSPDDPPSEDESDDEEMMLGDGRVEEVGRWRRKKDGKFLGEGGKVVEFTVIGMQVTNQMLSLTGSLLSDPTNPPPQPSPLIPAQAHLPTPSPSPEPEARPYIPTRAPLTIPPPPKSSQKPNTKPQAYDSKLQPQPSQAATQEVIDERYLNPRELKLKRKEDERRKKEERKARKEEKGIEGIEVEGGGEMVDMDSIGVEPGALGTAGKRKSGEEREGGKKRRKDKA